MLILTELLREIINIKYYNLQQNHNFYISISIHIHVCT